MRKPKVFKTTDRPVFSDLDPHRIVNSEKYLSYFLKHRMTALRENLGWDMKTMFQLPFAFVIKEVNIKYLRPLYDDSEFEIHSHVSEWQNMDALVDCTLLKNGKENAKCRMVVTAIDPKTQRPMSWPDDIVEQFYE